MKAYVIYLMASYLVCVSIILELLIKISHDTFLLVNIVLQTKICVIYHFRCMKLKRRVNLFYIAILKCLLCVVLSITVVFGF
jgi:hypothetical protein